jgi:Protein of unknown function (DUF2852)
MSDSGMSYQSCSTRQNDRSHGCGYWHGEPWKPVEILAMVLGFIVYWPIGFAVLGWKFWQKKSGYPGDIISFAREKWANWAHGSDRRGFAVKNWRPPALAWARPEIAPSTNGAPLNSPGRRTPEACCRRARIRGIHGKSPPRQRSRGVRAVHGCA